MFARFDLLSASSGFKQFLDAPSSQKDIGTYVMDTCFKEYDNTSFSSSYMITPCHDHEVSIISSSFAFK